MRRWALNLALFAVCVATVAWWYALQRPVASNASDAPTAAPATHTALADEDRMHVERSPVATTVAGAGRSDTVHLKPSLPPTPGTVPYTLSRRPDGPAEVRLRAAIKDDSLAELTAYLDSRVDINALLPSGESALHLAVAFDRPQMAEILIESGADPELRNRRGQTPVHMARGNTLDLLLQFGVDSGVHDGLGATPLHHARRETALMLIDQGVDIEARDRAGGTPLLRAVERGDFEVVQLLVDYGADVNVSDVRRGATAVHRAVARRDLDLIRYLLSQGAYINARDRYGSTPLDWTESPLTGGGRPDTLSVVHLLIENGAH